MAKTVRVNLGICGNPRCEDCWVDMRVCEGCGRGPLSDHEDDCGGCDEDWCVDAS